jgi:hypothetical protein
VSINVKEDHELIETYKHFPNKLVQAIEGLSDSDLDKTREIGKWTIREIIHHIIDCDMNYFQIDRFALADTGAKFMFNEFDGNVWVKAINYNNRPVELELKLFGLMREYIAYLCSSLPNSLDRVLVHEHGRAKVRDAIEHDWIEQQEPSKDMFVSSAAPTINSSNLYFT